MKKTLILTVCVLLIVCSVPTYSSILLLEDGDYEQKIPVIMYHLVTSNSKYHGKFGISPKELENDLQYLKENGYETVFVEDLINFVNYGEQLPDKPIMLTFDDGSGSDYHYVFPLLKKYNMKAVLSVVAKLADDFSKDTGIGKKPHLTWSQIKEMSDSGYVEIQNHSFDMHGKTGSGKIRSESEENYKLRLKKDLLLAQKSIENNTGHSPTAFAYPLGIISEVSKGVVRELGFSCTFSCAEGINTISVGNADCLYLLRRNNRRSGVSVKEILRKIEKL